MEAEGVDHKKKTIQEGSPLDLQIRGEVAGAENMHQALISVAQASGADYWSQITFSLEELVYTIALQRRLIQRPGEQPEMYDPDPEEFPPRIYTQRCEDCEGTTFERRGDWTDCSICHTSSMRGFRVPNTGDPFDDLILKIDDVLVSEEIDPMARVVIQEYLVELRKLNKS